MKVIGIEIKGREIRLVALEKNETENILDITGNYKPLKLENDEEKENVMLFKNTLFSILDSFSPDLIGIKWRNPNPSKKGFKEDNNFSSSPISFKIEGIIQLYPTCNVKIISPNTVAAFLRKNEMEIEPKYGYQLDAFKMAYCLTQKI
jgi:Protein of unknown function (DUF3010)